MIFIFLPNIKAQYNITDTIADNNQIRFDHSYISHYGNILAVSNYLHVNALDKNGIVEVYKKEKTWKLNQKIILPDNFPLQNFGGSVAINDQYLIVGAPAWNAKSYVQYFGNGKVYIYKQNNGQYELIQTLSGRYDYENEFFGSRVWIADSTIFVYSPGAYEKNSTGRITSQNIGAIGVYALNKDKFEFHQELRSPVPSTYGQFGYQVSFCDKNLMVSASKRTYPGIVFIHQQVAGMWKLIDSLKPIIKSKGNGDDRFGECISCYKNRMAIAASHFEDKDFQEGRVFIYKKDKENWLLDQILKSDHPFELEHFGANIVLNEQHILISNQPVMRSEYPRNTTVKFSNRYNALKRNHGDTILDSNVALLSKYDSLGILIRYEHGRHFFSSQVMEFSTITPDITHYNIRYHKAGKITNQEKLEPEGNFKVCRDGSISSLFKVVERTNKNHVVFRIKEAAQNKDTNRYGKLILHLKLADTLWYLYKHPEYIASSKKYSESLTLQLYDTITQQVLKSGTLEVLNVPIMMVHGIWSDPSAFNKMEMSLINTGLYDLDLLHKVDYEGTHAMAFISNKLVVPNNLKIFKANLIEAGISVGKFDIITHSMGGILTRSYLQSLLYKDDIHKLIGLNVPHSGSALCNYILESPKLALSLNLLRYATNKGAVEDFKIKSWILEKIINGSNLNLNKIPIHSIVTRTQRAISPKDKRIIYDPGFVTSLLGFDFVKRLHGEDNDEVVALSSQGGGLSQENITQIDGQVHLGSASVTSLIDTVISLLNLPISDSKFSIKGFNPVKLFYNRVFIPDQRRMALMNDSKPNVSILNTSTNIRNTDTVYFATHRPSGYTSLKLILVDPSGNSFSGESDKALDTLIWIDKGRSLGLFNILLIGSTASDPLAFIDTSSSILIKPDKPFSDIYTELEEFQMSTGESKIIHVFAHDSSGNIFEITNLPGVNIDSEKEFVLYDSLSNQILARKPGVTTAHFTYRNLMSNEMVIHVTEPPVLPFIIRESISQPVCGNANGTIDLQIEGTFPPFEYLWSDSSISPNRNGLAPGFYEVLITDHEGNIDTKEYYLESKGPPPFKDLWPNKDTVIHQGSVITLSAYGGTRYQWSTGDTTSSINAYKVGAYSVHVENDPGCMAYDTINISYKDKAKINFLGLPSDLRIAFNTVNDNIQITPKKILDRFIKIQLVDESGTEIKNDSWKILIDDTKIELIGTPSNIGDYRFSISYGFKKLYSIRKKTFTISIK